MRLSRWSIWRYTLPLHRALTVESASPRTRQGLVLRLTDENGVHGLGEAAPLPGLHPETLEDATEQLIAWCRNASAPSLEAPVETETLCGTVRFAVDSALDEMRAPKAPQSGASVYSAGLVDGSDEQCIAQAVEQAKAGVRALKIKVGRRPLSEEIALIRALRSKLDPTVELRADANRSWSFEEAVGFAVIKNCVSFVEEPLRDPAEVPRLARETGLAVALDESVHDNPHLRDSPEICAVVLKPTLLGDWNTTFAWMEWARSRNRRAIVSATFEAGVGQRALVRIAQAAPSETHGLGTWKWFADDVIDGGPRFENGALSLSSETRPALRADRLEPLAGSAA